VKDLYPCLVDAYGDWLLVFSFGGLIGAIELFDYWRSRNGGFFEG